MQTPKRISRILTALILATMLLPWDSGSLSGTARAACPVTAENWQEVGTDSACAGGISDNSGHSEYPSVAIALDSTPYVAWMNRRGVGGHYEIYVRRWNGSSWEEVGAGSASGGGISDNSGSSFWPSVAIAPDGTPYVAWNDDSGGDWQIYVRRWNGSSWEEVGTGSATGGGISDNSGDSTRPSVAIAPDGTPYVAWNDDSSGNVEIYVRRWNGGSWEEVGAGSATGGGISDDSDVSRYPSVAIAPDGTPYVAWYDLDYYSGEDPEIYVRRWNGGSWGEVGAGSASGGGISDNSRVSTRPSVAIAPDGTPYIAWLDYSGGASEIYVRRWNGSSWEEVGAGSASGGGVSDNSDPSFYPSLAIATDGTPYVVWDNGSSTGDLEIYVRRWNGSSWEEVGAGSASGGGISDNSRHSVEPSVAIAPDGTPYVAWYDSSSDDLEIYVRRWGGGGSPQPFTISPIYPTAHTITSTVMQGGTAYRHFHLTDSGGSPIPNATVTLSTGGTAISDASGYFTATVQADGLGGLGSHAVSVQSVTYGGQTYSTDSQPSFTVQVTERHYSHAWGYGASTRLKGGVSAGLIIYVQRENSGGLELTLDESDPGLTSDDVVLMKEHFSDEIGAGGGVGLEKGVSIVILQVKGDASAVSERYIRTLGSTTARFPNPYESDDKKAQAIFLLASVIDSFQNAFPGKPFGVAFLRSALDLGAPYTAYIIEQQAGMGAKITPLQANVGASAALGLKRGGVTWKERILGFDLVDVGVTVLTLDTFTDYRGRGEIGLGSEAEFDLDFSALSWQIGDFRDKFAGTIGERAKKIHLEIILDADTHGFKRLELSLTGEGNPYAFTDVVKEEVTVKAIIPADQLTGDVLLQTVNVLRLLQAAHQTGSNPLQIGPSAMVNELNALLAPLGYVEYEVSVDDGAQTNYETSLGVTLGIDIELGPGLEVKKTRSLVRERGVFVNGHPYRLESYKADSYVSQPGKGWWDLTTNALGGLWEYVKDAFNWVWQQVTSGIGWVIGTVSKTVGGVIQGGAQITAPPGTQLYATAFGSQGVTIQQTEPITVTAVGWVPTGTVGISSLGLSPAVAAASGESFVVGGIYEFQPYTLTVSPAATLVITYTDEAATGVDESHIGMFHWNPEGNNWQPMAAQADPGNNTFIASITQLGTFALGYDDTPPQISILTPADGSTISNTLPLISALVADTGVGIDSATVEMQMDSQVVAADYITGTGQLVYLPATPLASGMYTVSVSAADVVENASTATATFTVGEEPVEEARPIYLPVIMKSY